MTRKLSLGGVAAVGVMVVLAAAIAQEQGQTMTARQVAEYEAWMKFMTPGPQHEKLAARAGTFSVTCKAWMEPGAQPLESYGTSKIKPIMGGRYLLEEFEGDFMGQPLIGLGVVGYDNLRDEYVATWVDSMGTGIMALSGTGQGDTITLAGEAPDPLAGKYEPCRLTMTQVDRNTFVMKSFHRVDGEERLRMELTYARK